MAAIHANRFKNLKKLPHYCDVVEYLTHLFDQLLWLIFKLNTTLAALILIQNLTAIMAQFMKPLLTAALIDNDHTYLLSLKLKRGQCVISKYLAGSTQQINWRRVSTRLCLVIPSQFVHMQSLANAQLGQRQAAMLYQDSFTLPGSGSLHMAGHDDAIERLLDQLPVPATILEPAPQAWVRYSNYLLPSLPPYADAKTLITEWMIICKEHSLYILLRVERGVLVSLHSISRLDAIHIDSASLMILSYLSTNEDSQIKTYLPHFKGLWINIGITAQLIKQVPSVLFGAALRGFFPWRG